MYVIMCLLHLPVHMSSYLQYVYFQVIFDLMLSSSFDMDIIHATSGAVYAIICSHEVQCHSALLNLSFMVGIK